MQHDDPSLAEAVAKLRLLPSLDADDAEAINSAIDAHTNALRAMEHVLALTRNLGAIDQAVSRYPDCRERDAAASAVRLLRAEIRSAIERACRCI